MSIYSFPTLFVSIYTLVLGIVVICANPKARLNRICFLLTTTSFTWLFSYGLMYLSTDYDRALKLAHVGHVSAVLIVPIVYWFLLEVLGDNKKRLDTRLAIISTIAAIIAAILCYFSPTYMSGLSKRYWGYYPVGGLYMLIYTTWTFIIAFRSLYLLNHASKNAIRELQYSEYQKFKFYALALIVFIFAAIDYLPKFSIDIYPLGFIFVGLFSSLITYAIIRHRLLNVHIVIRRSFVYSALISLITVFYLSIILLTERLFKSYFGYASLVNGIVTAAVIAVTFNPVRERLQHWVDNHFFKIDPDKLAKENSRLMVAVENNDRMKAVATLAAGMAHEIKNPLTSIKTFTEILPKKSHDPDFIAKFQSIVGAEVDKIDGIVKQLLEFSKPTPAIFIDCDIITILRETIQLLEADLLKRMITVTTQFQKPNAIIRGDKVKLKQAFLNIFLNGIQAMPNGGILTVSTQTSVDSSLLISIQDTGSGISNEDLPHIFDPFFTTKIEGSGLGLAVVHGIIREHKGRITANSFLGIGSEFQLVFLVGN